jgi:Na+-transporting methylmalonyl-CoA/oxaloacetate decarboxylase beta subunit
MERIKRTGLARTVFSLTILFAVLAIGIVGVSASGPTYISGNISSNILSAINSAAY